MEIFGVPSALLGLFVSGLGFRLDAAGLGLDRRLVGHVPVRRIERGPCGVGRRPS